MTFLDNLIKILPAKPVFAHCDIPCGIYDPHTAQLAAKTVATIVQKLNELPKDDMNNFVRMVLVKEEHAEICKREILILWTDYFKAEHLEKFPDLHDLVWKIAKLCSENKRHVDEGKAAELIEAVDKIADIFNQTKKMRLPVSRFTVSGNSMFPSLIEGQDILSFNWAYIGRKPQVGEIIVLSLNGKELIKRVIKLEGEEVFVEGDNKQESTDSRDFGAISIDRIIGKVVYRN